MGTYSRFQLGFASQLGALLSATFLDDREVARQKSIGKQGERCEIYLYCGVRRNEQRLSCNLVSGFGERAADESIDNLLIFFFSFYFFERNERCQ